MYSGPAHRWKRNADWKEEGTDRKGRPWGDGRAGVRGTGGGESGGWGGAAVMGI